MHTQIRIVVALLMVWNARAQLPVARDSITVVENGRTLRMPWAGGVNYVTVSQADLNFDTHPDLVLFEKQNTFGIGRFRCFINTGLPGRLKYRHDAGLSYFFPQALYWAILRDYDGDGLADLFCSTNGGIKVYRNVSTPQNILKFQVASDLLISNYYPGSNPPSRSNLYAGTAGVPGLADIDNDQDLDVLTYTPLGIFLELHRNMSRELYGNSDSLVFQRDDNCWGDLSESDCSVNFEICSSAQKPAGESKTYHAGSCITCLDSDGDLDQDLIMGDMNCNFVHYVHNTGNPSAADFTDTTSLYPNFPAKNANGTSIRISHFPCAYIADADDDGRTDLLASPNAVGSENFNSLWYYRDVSSTATVNFQLQQKNFLQDEMIDVGQNAYPALFDFDGDGRKDLLLGTHGYFTNGTLSSGLTLYRNTGSASVPAFSLVTRDYLQLSAHNLHNIMAGPGDIDGDGDIDILIGVSSGQVHWLKNTAGPSAPPSFAPIILNPFQFTTPSAVAAPNLFDLDGDGKLDLLIGMKNGRIAFFRNTGSGTAVTFSLITSALGGVDVKGDPTMYGLDGFASPYFYTENNTTFVLVGSVSGDVARYQVANASSPFILLEKRVNGLTEGAQSTVMYEDINADGKRDLFIGQASGGISFFSSNSPYVGIAEWRPAASLKLFPNPARETVMLSIPTELHLIGVDVVTPDGRLVQVDRIAEVLDVSTLPAGLYIVNVRVAGPSGEHRTAQKLLIER